MPLQGGRDSRYRPEATPVTAREGGALQRGNDARYKSAQGFAAGDVAGRAGLNVPSLPLLDKIKRTER